MNSTLRRALKNRIRGQSPSSEEEIADEAALTAFYSSGWTEFTPDDGADLVLHEPESELKSESHVEPEGKPDSDTQPSAGSSSPRRSFKSRTKISDS